MNDDQARRRRPGEYDFPRTHDDDSFNDQRNPQPELGNRPRHWQGRGTGERGPWRDEPEFDRRYPPGPGNQYGRAGDYGRSHQDRTEPEPYDTRRYADDDYGRGREKIRDEGYAGRGYPRDHTHPGAHSIGPDERLYSRSADPGQSSYGGFKNEDTRYQAQQEARRQRILPKGYARSDERLREDVCERLGHSGLDVGDVSVAVSEGKVTLEGTVKDRRSKHAIENCVDDCLGVQDIDNRIRVSRGESPMSIGA